MYLEVKDLCKSYGEGGSYAQVLKNVSLEVQKGEMCVIQGTSGSGKSTLLNCIGGLDSKTSREILVLLERVNAQYGTTMLIVTHNNVIKQMVHQVVILKDGQIEQNYHNAVRTPAAQLEDAPRRLHQHPRRGQALARCCSRQLVLSPRGGSSGRRVLQRVVRAGL